MHKYKKGFLPIWALLIIAIGIASAAIIAFPRPVSSPIISPIPSEATPTPSATPNFDLSTWKTYRNTEYGFEVKYPPSYQIRTSPDNFNSREGNWIDDFIGFASEDDRTILGVVYMSQPKKLYPNTDLDGVFVALQTSAQSKINCGKSSHWIQDKGMENIGGIIFRKTEGGSGAAGHQESRNEYSAYVDGLCYIFSEVIHTSGFGAIDGLKQVNSDEVYGNLTAVLSTFKFIETEGKFCGGIAAGAFPCPDGYICKLDGTYPDAGGHCIKSQTAMGTLSGRVSIGPICPVERPGEPCPVPPEAYAAREFLVFGVDRKEPFASFHADANGNYSVLLPPGAYEVMSAKTGIGYMSKDLPKTIEIKANQTTTLSINVDTGIR